MSDGARSEGQHSAFVWKTNKRDGVTSPWFKTQQREFFLVFFTGWSEESDYRLRLSNKEPPPSPFDVSVFLIIGEESASAPCTTTVRKRNETIVWKTKKSDLSKIDPDFERKTFRFVIVVHDPGAPGQEHTAKVAKTEGEQAGRYKESAFTSKGLKETGDKSVQTPTYLDPQFKLDKLSEDFAKLLDDSTSPDVDVVCGDQTFRAHKHLLGCRSDVFRAMLQSEMLEGKTGRVQVKDMEPGLFGQFLRHLYTAQLPEMTVDRAMRLYEVGDEYNVEGLKKQCASFLQENMAHDNVCKILSLADRHSDPDLEEIATVYVLEQKIPLKKELWSSFCNDHPILALKVVNRFCMLQATCK